MIDHKWIILIFTVVLVLGSFWSFYMFKQCEADGYNRTQCLMMLQVNNTTNLNTFGIGENNGNTH